MGYRRRDEDCARQLGNTGVHVGTEEARVELRAFSDSTEWIDELEGVTAEEGSTGCMISMLSCNNTGCSERL